LSPATGGQLVGRPPLASSILDSTTRIKVGAGIVSPFARHPHSLAADAAVLSERSGGVHTRDRFRSNAAEGLGTGSPSAHRNERGGRSLEEAPQRQAIHLWGKRIPLSESQLPQASDGEAGVSCGYRVGDADPLPARALYRQGARPRRDGDPAPDHPLGVGFRDVVTRVSV